VGALNPRARESGASARFDPFSSPAPPPSGSLSFGGLARSDGTVPSTPTPLCPLGVVSYGGTPPTVSGPNPTHVGDTISTSYVGTWSACGEAISSYNYQWLRGGVAIPGATSSSYTVQSGNADVGAALQVEVEGCSDLDCYSSYVPSSNSIVPQDRPPNLPSGLSPSDGSTQGTTPTLSALFTDPDGQSGYLSYQVYSEWSGGPAGNGNGPWVWSGNASSWSRTLPAGDHYEWYVLATDYSGETSSAWVGPTTFVVPPSVPQLNSPAGGATLATTTPVLSATASSAAPIYYDFQVASDAGFTSVVADSGWVPTTSTWTVPPGFLQDGHTYYWRAASGDAWGDTSTWSAVNSFSVRLAKLGVRGYWPMWSHGPLAVNEANGNLVVSVPGPSYPTAAGSMGASLTYNSQPPNPPAAAPDNGFGPGWVLNDGDQGSSPPSKLIDHNASGASPSLDAIERVSADGSSDYYTHVGNSSTYLSSPGDGSQLTKNSDNSWTLLDPDGSIYIFNPETSDGTATLKSAELVQASPGKGTLTYTFSTVDPTKITSISDDGGRTLSFYWHSLDSTDCSDAILCVKGPDLVVWRYIGANGTSGNLTTVSDGTRNLVQIGYGSNGLVSSIKNADDLDPSHASPNYNGSHALTIAYDTNTPPRVSSVSDGPVTNQTPASSTWSFRYQQGLVQPTPPRASHYGYLVRNDGPLAYYPLDETTGTTAADASGNGNNATYSGGYSQSQSGALAGTGAGTGVAFSGGTVSGSAAHLDQAPGGYNTVEFWVNWNGANAVMPFGFANYDLFFDQGDFGFNTACSDLYGTTAPSANSWHYVVAEFYNGYPESGARLWIDGVPQTLSLRIGSECSASVGSSFNVSGWPNDGNYRMGGNIDEVAIYGYALSPDQIAAHFAEALHNRSADGYTTLTPPNQQGLQSPASDTTYFDSLGHPIETVDTLGRTSESYYNDKNELVWSEDADGNPTDYLYGGPSGQPSGDPYVPDTLLQTIGPDPDGSGPVQRPITTNRYDEAAIGTPQAAGPSLNGLRASYYDNPSVAGRAKATENDSNVDFSWTQGPLALSGYNLASGFSVRWTGDLLVTNPGSYTFSTPSSTGTRLTIDGTEAVNNWTTNAPSSQPITLSPGLHAIMLDYFSSSATGAVHLNWSCGACSPAIPDNVIPTTSLLPGWLNQTSTVSAAGRISFSHYATPATGQPDYSLVQAVAGAGQFPTLTANGGQGGGAATSCAGGGGGSGGAASSGSSISASYSGGSGGTGYVYCANGAVNGGAGGSSAGTSANGNNGQDGCYYTCTAYGGAAPAGGGAGGNAYWSNDGPIGDPGSSPGGGGGAAGASQCCTYYGAGNGADGQATITPNLGTATTYTSAGNYTYTVPSGVTSLTVQLWGAGGGGGRGYTTGGSYSGNYGESGGGGGGGGAYLQTTSIQVGSGETLSITVGAGGAAGANGGCGYTGTGGCGGTAYGPASPGTAGIATTVQETAPPTGNPPLLTTYTYDTDGRLAQQVMPKGNAGRSIDAQGNLPATPGPDLTYATTYTYYDATGSGANAAPPAAPNCSGSNVNQGQQLKTAATNGEATTTYVYDSAGNTIAKTNGAGTTCSQYDNEDRLSSAQAPGDALPTTYTYDPNGTQLTATGRSASYLGEYGQNTSNTSTTTKTITLSGAPGAGAAVFLRIANTTTAPSTAAVTDSRGNTWTRLAQGTTGTPNSLYATLQNAAPLRAGDTVTVTWSTNVTGFAGVLDAFTGITSLTADKTATASSSHNTTARDTGTTATTTQASELQIAAWGINANETSFTPTSGASQLHTPYLTNSALVSTEGEYRFVNATGAYNLNATGGVSAKYNGFIVTLPAVATSTATTYYDEQGRLIDTIDRNGTTTADEARYTYDADSNPVCRSANTQSLSSTTCPNATDYGTTYSYDAADQLSGETNQRDTAHGSYSFCYDNRGNLRAIQYPNVTFSWVDTNPDGWTADQYNRHGTIYNGACATTPTADASPLADYTYTYDQDGKRLSELRKSGSTSQTTTYSYDNLGRLNQVILPSGNCRNYSYDADSNRTQTLDYTTGCSGATTATNYTYNPSITAGVDELSSIGSTNYTYTSDGQTSSQGTTSYTWDGWARIKTTTVGSNTVTYTYDPAGALKTRASSSPSSTLNYLLGDLFETNASGTTTTSYTDGPAGNLASYNGPPTSTSTPTYLYYDAHGNLAAEADTTGAITGDHTYDPFGAPTDSTPSNTTIHRFVGRWNKQYDTATGLILMGARPYDPSTGRFLSVDPIPGGSLNNYDYAGQDPINNYDLNGECLHISIISWCGTKQSPVAKYLYNHSGQIAAIAAAFSFVPGADVVAIGFGGLAAYKDRHHPLALTLDVVGAASGGVGLRLGRLAEGFDRAASEMRYAKYARWLRQDAAALRHQSGVFKWAAFGLVGVPLVMGGK
jgi:RHS repeat-associated protein